MMRIIPFVLALLCAGAASGADAGRPRVHGGGKPVTTDELPPGPFHDRIAGLPPAAQAHALDWLSRFEFHDFDCGDLRADDAGGIFFACSNAVPAPAGPRPRLPVTGAASVPIANTPSYHSKPGASRRIYLDFNGATVTGTAWSAGTLVAKPYDLDGDETTFNDAEQLAIHRIWQRVAEDYAPFDVDVTTDPALESSLNNNTAHVVITRDTDATGKAMPSQGAGGVAYISVFGQSNYASTYSPAWVYFSNLGGGEEDYVAEACSHETGHNVGLSHDGTNAQGSGSYYGGHGSGATSWAPIMGVGYGRNVTQFSKGEYYDANQPQDDFAIITGYLPYRTDDYGDTDATATAISGPTLNASGIIERAGDVDVVSFNCGAGAVSITVSPWQSAADTKGGDLDVKLDLVDGSGTIVASADDTTTVTATISTTVVAGTYFLHISGTGWGTPLANPPSGYTAYGSRGQWFLSGTTPTPLVDSQNPQASATFAAITSAGGTTYQFTVTYSDDIAVDASTIDTGDLQVTGPTGSALTVTAVSVSPAGNGTPRSATYTVGAPGGSWDWTDDGVYTVAMKASQVKDTSAKSVAAGTIGTFSVGIAVPAGTGTGVLREWWDGIGTGTTVASLTGAAAYLQPATGTAIAAPFEAPTNRADAYGTRMRGWFLAPLTGGYVFQIASDDASELWLSSDASAAHLAKIAQVNGATNQYEWTKESGQTSSAVALVAGQHYFIQALHKEGTGSDHVEVGVIFPGGYAEEPIAGNRLVPIPVATVSVPDAAASESGDTGQVTITLSAPATQAATIAYAMSGTATNGSDYNAVSGSVSIASGASSASITIAPKADALTEGAETAILTLAPGGEYAVGSANSGSVTIADVVAAAPPPGGTGSPTDGGSPKCGFGAIAALLGAGFLLVRRRRS
jgi:hypothetical protein